MEIYRHVGERVRLDLSKKGIPQARYVDSTHSACRSLFTNVCQLPPSCFCMVFHTAAQTADEAGNDTGCVSQHPGPLVADSSHYTLRTLIKCTVYLIEMHLISLIN